MSVSCGVTDLATGKELFSLPDSVGGDIALNADGTILALAGTLGSTQIEIWDVNKRRRTGTLRDTPAGSTPSTSRPMAGWQAVPGTTPLSFGIPMPAKMYNKSQSPAWVMRFLHFLAPAAPSLPMGSPTPLCFCLDRFGPSHLSTSRQVASPRHLAATTSAL